MASILDAVTFLAHALHVCMSAGVFIGLSSLAHNTATGTQSGATSAHGKPIAARAVRFCVTCHSKGARIMTLQELKTATRAELIAYLESWGFACYSHEKTPALRAAAVENFKTEGA
jgi:hypothetical protein